MVEAQGAYAAALRWVLGEEDGTPHARIPD